MPWNNRKHTTSVDGYVCGYTCGNGREDQETRPRETQPDTTVRMHLQRNVFPYSLTLQCFHSTMSSQAVATGHSTAAPRAELVLLLQPAPLLP